MTSAQLVSLIRPVLERLAGELTRSLEYFHQESDLLLRRMVLTGGASRLKGVDRFLEEKVGLSVEPLALPLTDFFTHQNIPAQPLENDFPVWAATLALASRRTVAPFDLLPERFREKKGEKIERVAVRMSAFAFFLTLIILFFFKGTQVQVLDKQAQVYRDRWRGVQEIATLHNKIQERKGLIQQLLKGHPFFVGVLKEISVNLSPNAVLGQIQYQQQTHTLSLTGTIFEAGGVPTEGALGELISRLEQSPFFKEVRLVSSERDEGYGQPASSFQIQCDLVTP